MSSDGSGQVRPATPSERVYLRALGVLAVTGIACLLVVAYLAVQKVYEGDSDCGRLISPGPRACRSYLEDQYVQAGLVLSVGMACVVTALVLNQRLFRARSAPS